MKDYRKIRLSEQSVGSTLTFLTCLQNFFTKIVFYR